MNPLLEIILSSDKPLEDQVSMIKAQGLSEQPWVEIYLHKFLTVDPTCLALKDKVRQLATVREPVIIYGETGTGKQLIAQALHGRFLTDKSLVEKPFVHLNCAGLPDSLFESELFGHAKGAFTGAITNKIGLIFHAKHGTLFLDEVAEMPLVSQAKLLTAIQEGVARPIGDNESSPVNCRFICATHHKLEDDVKAGKFREDLYWRLSTHELTIPAINCRVETEVSFLTCNLCPDFPMELVEKIPLSGNVRSIQRSIARWKLYGHL